MKKGTGRRRTHLPAASGPLLSPGPLEKYLTRPPSSAPGSPPAATGRNRGLRSRSVYPAAEGSLAGPGPLKTPARSRRSSSAHHPRVNTSPTRPRRARAAARSPSLRPTTPSSSVQLAVGPDWREPAAPDPQEERTPPGIPVQPREVSVLGLLKASGDPPPPH